MCVRERYIYIYIYIYIRAICKWLGSVICNWNIYHNSFLPNAGPKLKSSEKFLLRPHIPNLSGYMKFVTVSVQTQHCIKSEKPHVSAVQNSHLQTSWFRNINSKSYSRSYILNVWLQLYDFLIVFPNREDRWWLFCTAETRGFLDLTQCCV
jgi:hypothetical protein